jgi:flagellar biosynthesis chaperone FliJ
MNKQEVLKEMEIGDFNNYRINALITGYNHTFNGLGPKEEVRLLVGEKNTEIALPINSVSIFKESLRIAELEAKNKGLIKELGRYGDKVTLLEAQIVAERGKHLKECHCKKCMEVKTLKKENDATRKNYQDYIKDLEIAVIQYQGTLKDKDKIISILKKDLIDEKEKNNTDQKVEISVTYNECATQQDWNDTVARIIRTGWVDKVISKGCK